MEEERRRPPSFRSFFTIFYDPMMIRKKISLLGAVVGLFYAFIGVAGAYYDPSLTGTPGRLAIEFLVISMFTAPLGGMIGLGFGFLVEGLVQTLFKRQPERVARRGGDAEQTGRAETE